MTNFRKIGLILLCILALPVQAQLTLQQLGDSLTDYTGFSSVWSSKVRVKQMRVNRNNITLKTNRTLHDVRWSPASIADIKRKVSRWILGHEKGNVTIYTGRVDIETLVTDCAKSQSGTGKCSTGKCRDLADRNIVLWPSHGLYYNKTRDEWIWQRATLWTTVEDLFSHEYVRLVRRMLENAGASVYMPRAGLENQEIGVSGMPQWTEGARYWLASQGVTDSIWDLYDGDEYKDDMKCRAMWVNSLDEPIDLCIALHTDGQDSGNDSTTIGTLVIYTAKDDEGKTTLRDGRDRETTNRNLADWVQTQLTQDLRHLAPNWTRRQLLEANYCESRVPVVPSIILEVLSHKNMADMKYGLDPNFRFAASRAVYKGILRFINGKNAVVQPLPVKEIAIDANGLLKWRAQADSIEPSAKPTYYLVYVQENDGEWDVQQVDKRTEIKLPFKRGVRYNYYVIAGNDGGLSLPSPTISAYMSERDDAPMALVIDGFNDTYGPEWFSDSTYAGIVPGSYACEDYISCAYIGQQWDYNRSHPWKDDDNCGWGACDRDHAGQITIGNTHDWSAQHGHVLRRMRISYTSATAGMSAIDSTYTFVDVICGRNRQPLSETLKTSLADYISNGGKVLLSTDHFSAIDQDWAKTNLHATFHAPHATRNGRISTPRRRLFQLQLEPNEEQIFTCTPEALKPFGDDAKRMAEYQDMRCPAAIGWKTSTLVYAFPLEAIQDFDKIYKHSIEWLLEK